MYEAFYGLSSHPFKLNPDPHFYFSSKQHSRAKAYLDYGVARNDGFIVITGEVGAGKTTVLHGLLKSLERSNIVAGHLVTSQLDAEDILRMVGAAFGFNVQTMRKAELLSALEAFLLTQVRQGKRCLLVVDEAQNLTPRAVEELRMLSNFQLGNQSLLQSFVVGQPEFRETLQRPEMEQFRQRVAATCHIGPLDLAETEAYIPHRLKCAGSTGEPHFEPLALHAIHAASQGIPRRINSICDRLLLLGFMENRKQLTVADVDTVIRDFATEAAPPAKKTPSLDRAPNGTARDTAVTLRGPLDIDLALPDLAPDDVEDMSRKLEDLDSQHFDGRLQRLELGQMRVERMVALAVKTLQELIRAISKSRDDAAR
jgi:general secretion pathway protein A